MSKVIKKTVSRWFVNGKGYPNETLARRAEAKEILKKIIYKRAVQLAKEDAKGAGLCDWFPHLNKEHFFEAYAEMFPHPADLSCSKHNWKVRGICYRGESRFLYPWCRVAYNAWIDAKVEELRTLP